MRMKGIQTQIGEAESTGDQIRLNVLIKEYNQLMKEVTF